MNHYVLYLRSGQKVELQTDESLDDVIEGVHKSEFLTSGDMTVRADEVEIIKRK